MPKVLLIWLLVWSLHSYGSQKIEIVAQTLKSQGENIDASGDVVVYYGDAIIKSQTAHYDRKKELLTLGGEQVDLIGLEGKKIQSRTLEIETKSKILHFKDILLSTPNDIWIYSDKARRGDDGMDFGELVLSSCDINKSDWKLHAAKSEYDENEKYMKLHGVALKFWDVPIFYTPYLAFSTDSTRRSGLLFPSFGYTQSDGFTYGQPIYWAASKSWDVEFNPQIRTTRGQGVYATLRFLDSPHSGGALRLGYFRDNESYVSEHNLANNDHYGAEILYNSSELFKQYLPQDFHEGLYINATFLSDIEYINLQKSQLDHFGVLPIQESRLNYFLHNDDYYLGLNIKYFIDTRLEDNGVTIQQLPNVEFHKYLKEVLWDDFTYGFHFGVNNLTRDDGATLKVAQAVVPIEYSKSFLDDYLSIALKEEIYAYDLVYGNETFINDQYQSLQAIHHVELFSDLTKRYDTFVHVIQPSLSYNKPAYYFKGDIDFAQLSEPQKSLFTPLDTEENIALKLSHYFYDLAGNLKFFQRIRQNYTTEATGEEWGDLSNEMGFGVGQWNFFSYIVYSFEFDKIGESINRIGWSGSGGHSFSLQHSYEKAYSYDENQATITNDKINDVLFSASYRYSDRLSLTGGITYNIDKDTKTQWTAGFLYRRDCWSLELGLRRDIIPSGNDSIQENAFTFQLNLIPIGGIGRR